MTNYELIMSMSIEALAVFLRNTMDESIKKTYEKFRNRGFSFNFIEFAPGIEISQIKRWLESEDEEDE